MASPAERFLASIERGTIEDANAFSADASLDATVPNWRFIVTGGSNVEQELAGWYATPGRFESLRRTPLPGGGELIEFVLSWEEDGIPHGCHQAHILQLRDGLIVSDTAFCGGRWPASLMAEMEAAALADA
jgi:hypothetical protein